MGLRLFIISALVTFLVINILIGNFELRDAFIGFVIGIILSFFWQIYKYFKRTKE